MVLYLFRHGAALDVDGEQIRSDADRPLSDEGREKAARVVRGLHWLGIRPDYVVASPLLRAQQTAAILIEGLTPGKRLETSPLLVPGANPQVTARWLEKQPPVTTVLVGHLPHLERLAGLLLASVPDLAINLRKASVCCLSFENQVSPGTATLEWLMQPDQLRGLAKLD